MVSAKVLWGMVRAMVKVDIRSMAFANDPNITPRVLLSRYEDENRLDSTFNDGLLGCTVGYATGSVAQVALTGYGYLY